MIYLHAFAYTLFTLTLILIFHFYTYTYTYMLMRRVRQESKVPGLILGNAFPGGTIVSGK